MTTGTAPRARTNQMQGTLNKVIKGLLHTPGLSSVIGSRLIVVYVTGRKTGRRFAVPVAYTRHDGAMLFGSPFGWARNIRTGEQVEILLKGRKRLADVRVYTSEPEVTEAYTTICQDNRNFAQFNMVRLGPDGKPNADDIHAAWAAGARAFRLTPR
jgi:hypothetical protein